MSIDDPRSSAPRRVAAIYDRIAPEYDRLESISDRALGTRRLRAALGEAVRGDVLEVAIGSGRNLPFYGPAVTSVTGVDISRGMLAMTAAQAKELVRPVRLAVMNAERLGFADASFDTVATSLSLCTVPDPAAALREIARVCKPEGRVVLLEHVRSPVRPIAWLQRKMTPGQVRRLGCHFDRETIDLARSLDFGIVSERKRLFGIFRLVIATPPARQ